MQSKNVDVNISKIKKNCRLKSPSSIRVRVFSERCIDNRGHCAISPNSDRVTILKRFFLLDLRVASITVVNGTRLKASVLQVHGRGRRACAYIGQINGQIVSTVDWMQNSLGIEWSPSLCKFRFEFDASFRLFDSTLRYLCNERTNYNGTGGQLSLSSYRFLFSFFPPFHIGIDINECSSSLSLYRVERISSFCREILINFPL